MSQNQSEWQPVRIAPVAKWNEAHPNGDPQVDFHAVGKIVRVKESSMPPFMRTAYIQMGCKGKTFLIHPADVTRLGLHSAGQNTWLCEHQLEAD